ncbi:hypothetical protein CTheo_7398 [Ceratobasidium theobromae]|uniref:Uncharacterized protein n=1 Tax=Ceratobasidium theobromae TaxID=1582974 RepID=A0A5N5QBN0_9AGAM|nr:hypothetical protein CTheo_7398 [Ceratobasidium theobromae]
MVLSSHHAAPIPFCGASASASASASATSTASAPSTSPRTSARVANVMCGPHDKRGLQTTFVANVSSAQMISAFRLPGST